LPTYALAAGRNGAKFRAAEDDGSAAETGSGDGHQIGAHRISMKFLAATLQGYINLDFNVDESKSAEGPAIFDAVHRLGLKLEARKGPVEVVVIDHVDKPSAN
jgi:hypothetical protein